MIPGYTAADLARRGGSAPGRRARSDFARDRARVLHSASFRRLAAKTQIHTAGEADFPRTRLTHSLEVGQIARELGASLGADPDLVETGALAHDVGHPPFGHNGEEALDAFAADIGGFEGNAQTLRVLTRLESKAFVDGRSVGLDLTRASLDAATKYPWTRPGGGVGVVKFGAFDDDAPVLGWVRDGAPGARRCAEAQVMDFADDVAYSVHDVEDAIHAGHVTLAQVRAAAASPVGEGLVVDDPPATSEALQRLTAQPFWPTSYDGTQRSQAALKELTSSLIGRFCAAAHDATRAAHAGPVRRYDGDLHVPDDIAQEIAALKALSVRYVMGRDDAVAGYGRQRDLLVAVAESLLATAPAGLDPMYAQLFLDAPDSAVAKRVVVDQVAGLTDTSVLRFASD